MSAVARNPHDLAGCLRRNALRISVAFALSAAFPLPAHAATGAEVIADFQTHCIEPFPSIEEIAATALRSGYEERLLEAEDLFGSDEPAPILEHYFASIAAFDARNFAAPAGGTIKPMITAIAIKRIGFGGGLFIDNACNMSFEKADEGVAGLDVWIVGIARVLKGKFGFPFKWERKVKRELNGLSSGQIKWTPVGFPAFGEERFDVVSTLRFVEVQPGVDRDVSSTWFLSLTLQEVHE